MIKSKHIKNNRNHFSFVENLTIKKINLYCFDLNNQMNAVNGQEWS